MRRRPQTEETETRKLQAYSLWKDGKKPSEIGSAVGVSRQSVWKWIKEWDQPVRETAAANSMGKLLSIGDLVQNDDAAQVQLIEAIGKIGELYGETLDVSSYIERQRKVSDSMIAIIGNCLVEIQRDVAAGKARFIDYHKELRNLVATLKDAQQVFNLAAGLATNRLAVDMGMIEKTLANVPEAALDVWARHED